MDLAGCPFCGETTEFTVVGDWKGWPVAFVVCGTCHTRGPSGEGRDQAIANWNRRPTSTLIFPSTIQAGDVSAGAPADATTNTAPARGGEAGITSIAAARERRDLAGLPSLSTAANPDGLSMDFDLGGDKPKRKR